jgi:hypothetical protein
LRPPGVAYYLSTLSLLTGATPGVRRSGRLSAAAAASVR